MPIIDYLPEWLQPQVVGDYLLELFSILVPLVDGALALYIAYSLIGFFAGIHLLWVNEEDCREKDTHANDMLTYMASDIGIADLLLWNYEWLKEAFGVVREEDILENSLRQLRSGDMKNFMLVAIVGAVVGVVFGSYYTLALMLVQGVCYSIAYEYLVPVTFKYRKELNYELLEEQPDS